MGTKDFLIPIIPIPDIVFFPNTVIPIYIDEPVYIRMIKKRALEGKWVGISQATPIGEIGGVVRYSPEPVYSVGKPVILDENENGLKVLIRGVARMRMIEVYQNLPYLIYRAQIVPDDQTRGQFLGGETVERLNNILDRWLLENIPDSVEREFFYENLGHLQNVVDYICIFIIQDVCTRQLLLENVSLHERIQILNSLLREDDPFSENPLVAHAVKEYEVLENGPQEMAH